MYRATNDERVIATWYQRKEDEVDTYEAEGKSFFCKIVDKYSKIINPSIRGTISNNAIMILYATNCFIQMKPKDLIVIKGIGKYEVDSFQIDFTDPRFRNFGAHPEAMKQRCPKIISLI